MATSFLLLETGWSVRSGQF